MARERRDIPLELWERKEAALVTKQATPAPPHVCSESTEYVEFDGPLGQAWYCRVCGKLLQVG